MPAPAPVAPVGAALGDARPTEKMHAARPAFAGTEQDFYIIDKILLCHLGWILDIGYLILDIGGDKGS